MIKTYDPKCLDLAQRFISDFFVGISRKREELEHELAQEIQQTIKDFMEDNNLQ